MSDFFRPIVVLALCSLLGACTSGHRIQQGMTKDAVVAKLGQPIKMSKTARGGEILYYTAVIKNRQGAVSQNYERPGESVFERDLRIDTTGGVASAYEFSTTESYEEQPLHFDANGRLMSSPAHRFLPRE